VISAVSVIFLHYQELCLFRNWLFQQSSRQTSKRLGYPHIAEDPKGNLGPSILHVLDHPEMLRTLRFQGTDPSRIRRREACCNPIPLCAGLLIDRIRVLLTGMNPRLIEQIRVLPTDRIHGLLTKQTHNLNIWRNLAFFTGRIQDLRKEQTHNLKIWRNLALLTGRILGLRTESIHDLKLWRNLALLTGPNPVLLTGRIHGLHTGRTPDHNI